MSSDGACGWGMNDFQYFVWNVYAMFEASKFYVKRWGGSLNTFLNSTAFAYL
jgi:hypothetical protein